MKRFFIACVLILFTSFNAIAQKQTELSVPSQANFNIKLLSMSGVNEKKSTWEMSYELRIIDRETLYDLAKSGELMKEGSDIKHGELVSKNYFKKNNLLQMENREINLQIPFDEKTIEKLKSQQQNLSASNKDISNAKPTVGTKTPEIKSQVFLFYANALIYDAKLKKTIIVPFDWILPFSRHPNAKFEMTIEVKEDGSYHKQVVLPEKSKSIVTIPNKQ